LPPWQLRILQRVGPNVGDGLPRAERTQETARVRGAGAPRRVLPLGSRVTAGAATQPGRYATARQTVKRRRVESVTKGS